MELNPNNPVVREISDQWHKLAAIVMNKLGVQELEILAGDIDGMAGKAIVADARGGKFVLRLVTMEEGMKLAREHGGSASAH